jgi:hypothetical protein
MKTILYYVYNNNNTKIVFLHCNGTFLRNPYFHFVGPRGSVEHHLANNGLMKW